VESVRKWLSGEGRPKQDKCEALAAILGVDSGWLYMGEVLSNRDGAGDEHDPAMLGPVLPIKLRHGVIVEIHGLPLDLTEGEAKRISNIVTAHVFVDNSEGAG